MGDCFASLAMTYRVMPSDDFASALTWKSSDLAFSARIGYVLAVSMAASAGEACFPTRMQSSPYAGIGHQSSGDNRDELQDHDRLRAAVVRLAHRGGGFSQNQALHHHGCERRGGGPPRHPLAGPGRSLLRNTPGGRAVEEYRHRGGDRGGHGESVPRPRHRGPGARRRDRRRHRGLRGGDLQAGCPGGADPDHDPGPGRLRYRRQDRRGLQHQQERLRRPSGTRRRSLSMWRRSEHWTSANIGRDSWNRSSTA